MTWLLLLSLILGNFTWTDNSDNEDGFRLQKADSCTIDQQGNATSGLFNDIGEVKANVTLFQYDVAPLQCYRVYAFNAAGNSGFSNTIQIPTGFGDTVTLKTNAIVTVSRRANDASSIYSILVNANTNIGAGGLEITYPADKTLLVSRRASNTSSVIAILVNKSTSVIINGLQQ